MELFEVVQKPVCLGILILTHCLLILITVFFTRLFSRKRLSKEFKKQSRAVISGLINEQIAPLLDDFPGHPSDCRFLGKPVDYIVFHGLSEGAIEEIRFIEVKSKSTGQLNQNEREVKQAIEDKRVRWIKYSIEK